MLDGDVSHDRVMRFLSERDDTSKDLWLEVKLTVRKMEQADGRLIFDETIQEKAWTDENEVVCWHFDPCQGCTVKRINLLNALYHSGEMSIPVGFEVVRKPLQFCDLATRQVKRASVVTKSELLHAIVGHQSLKSNAALAKSPTCTETTQNKPAFMSIYAVFKLECLKLKHRLNHFALRAEIFIQLTQQMYSELHVLRTA
jgi:hypothetical protein